MFFTGRKAEAEKCNNNPVFCKRVQRQKASSKYLFMCLERCKTVFLKMRFCSSNSIEKSSAFWVPCVPTKCKFFFHLDICIWTSVLVIGCLFCKVCMWQCIWVGLHNVFLSWLSIWEQLVINSFTQQWNGFVFFFPNMTKVVVWVKRCCFKPIVG